MIRTVRSAAIAAALAAAGPGLAQGVFVSPNITDAPRETPRYTGAQAQTHAILRRFGLGDVDVRRLSPGQIALVNRWASSDRPQGEIRNNLETVVSGRGLGRRLLGAVTR